MKVMLQCHLDNALILFIYMSEQEAISDFNDQKMLTTQGEEPDFHLPRVEQHSNRPQVRSKAEKRRNSPILPLLKKSANSNYDITSDVPSKKTLPSDRERDQFALEIEEKLKLVLENVKQGENLDERSEEDEAEVDFEEAIQHNKEKIKQHKLQNQHKQQRPPKPHSREAKNGSSNRTKIMKSVNKHDNIYEKRMKEASLDNKFLQKKKEIIAQKHQAIEKAKQIVRQREEMQQQPHKQGSSIPLPVRFVTRPQNSPKKSPPKPQKQQQPSNNLFDNIHNLLENPLKNRVHSSSVNTQNLKSLQLKLHRLNQRLGVSQTIEAKTDGIGIANYTALDWKRFVYTDSYNFKCYQDSNFQKQMDKVGKLQEKNENYLNQYLDHQKTLVQLAFLKKLEGKLHSKA